MHEHLVDHHLEEDRRDQGHELDEEGGDEHVAQRAAIFDERRDEPADVERARIPRHPLPRGHQEQASGKPLLHLRQRPDFRAIAVAMLDEHARVRLLIVDLQEDCGVVTAKFRDRRERHLLKLVGPAPRDSADEPKPFRDPRQVLQRERRLALAAIVSDLHRIGRHAQKPGEEDEACQCRVARTAKMRISCHCGGRSPGRASGRLSEWGLQAGGWRGLPLFCHAASRVRQTSYWSRSCSRQAKFLSPLPSEGSTC